MRGLPLFIAWRYLWGNKKEKSISAMIKISFIGIFIGTFSLALILSIMNGFEKATHKKMKNIHSQLIMQANGGYLDFEKIKKILKVEFKQEIDFFCPCSIEHIIIQDDKTEEIDNIALIEGVDPKYKTKVGSLGKKIISEEKNFSKIFFGNKVLIGEKLANSLNLKTEDSITFLLVENQYRNKISFQKKYARIGGIFKTGIDEFDKKLIFCSLQFFKSLFKDNGITQIELNLKKNVNEEKTIAKLKDRFQLNVYSWKELYPALISALKLEKYVMFLILTLIILVASMSIISLLFMQIIQKRSDIAILKALGMSNNNIRAIFLYMGLSLSASASILGIISAFIAGIALKKYSFISLPDIYYVTHLPIKMEPGIFASVFFVSLSISFAAIYLPTRKIDKINISETLRLEI